MLHPRVLKYLLGRTQQCFPLDHPFLFTFPLRKDTVKMKICVLQSSYEDSDSALRIVDTNVSDPGAFTTRHEIANRFIHKEKFKVELDAIVAEGFDFYLNFMWGTLDDAVAGVEATRYFEWYDLPSAGMRSWELEENKNAFYKTARQLGSPRVPGTENFPLFVKPANGCASQLIGKHSLCRNDAELKNALRIIHRSMHDARLRRAAALGIRDANGYAASFPELSSVNDDVVVQEFIKGKDYAVTVVATGPSAIALTPCVFKTKEPPLPESFITFDTKFHNDTTLQALSKGEDPVLFANLQREALEAYGASCSYGNNMGCEVDLRVGPDGVVYVIEVNPMPAVFVPSAPIWDLQITHSLPGSHSAIIDVFIANRLLRTEEPVEISDAVANVYDGLANRYDVLIDQFGKMSDGVKDVVEKHDFSGTVFDLGCGTGLFGRLVDARTKNNMANCTLYGFDISAGMLAQCNEKLYRATHVCRMGTALLHQSRYAPSVDHIVCFSAIHFLQGPEFALFMVLCFALANESITISVDDIPDVYNEHLDSLGESFMRSTSHLDQMDGFDIPRGWRLIRGEKKYSWTSGATGLDVDSVMFRFERIDPATENRELMYREFGSPHRESD